MSFTQAHAKHDFGGCPHNSFSPTFILAHQRTAADVRGARGGEFGTNKPNKIAILNIPKGFDQNQSPCGPLSNAVPARRECNTVNPEDCKSHNPAVFFQICAFQTFATVRGPLTALSADANLHITRARATVSVSLDAGCSAIQDGYSRAICAIATRR